MAFLTSSDKALWHLALPMIFSNITVPLLGLVDTAVIGHLDSPVVLMRKNSNSIKRKLVAVAPTATPPK